MRLPDVQKNLVERSIPEPNTGCFLWLGCVDLEGYALIKVSGIKKRAARQLYICLNDTVPEAVGHTCNNKLCVNPNHLYATTFRENSNHAKRDGLYRTGVKHPRARVWSKEDVDHIYQMRDLGYSQQLIADKYGVHQCRISEVLRGKAIIAAS